METGLVVYVLIGFAAQIVDSSLGMAFGSLTSSLLLLIGLPPQSLSATVHMAEIFGGGASATAHWRMGNVDFVLLKKLAFPAILGAILGALLVTRFDNETLKPWIGIYFTLIGAVVIIKALRPDFIGIVKSHRTTLGFIGGFLDAFGGAGWGEFVASGLLLRNHDVRTAVGTLNIAEFMVAVTVSVIFYGTIGIDYWPIVIALALGAIMAAPLGAWICKRAPARPLMFFVGITIFIVGLKTAASLIH